ncbi:hypothetical protein Celaphus_00012212, partial [Cervus elaphus hippelaphus]
MNIIPNTCHPSLNQWWKNGLRTVCLNWSLEFNSKRLVNDNNILSNLQKERRMVYGPYVLYVNEAIESCKISLKVTPEQVWFQRHCVIGDMVLYLPTVPLILSTIKNILHTGRSEEEDE